MNAPFPIARRKFLRGAGVTLALPLLGAMKPSRARAASPAAAPPRRMICINTTLGLHTPNLFPEQAVFALSYDELESSLKYIFRHAPEWIGEYLPTKPKKPSTSKAKKPTVVEEKQSQKDDADGPQPTSNGEPPAPVKTSSGSVPAPAREEGRAAE